ncbi:Ricin-type beta-trefoil lectin domain-like [Pedobacter steynii]|uniref:Ricin-type beta-trefoil lectin domain-like n=1 Tax=Pedobacter steynii TaxID=430522 RepID=A0A1G9UMH4_9SPHI|nr:M12 family metallopeptidase [Pedobacter steynii]NQX40814.1 RICIN domain-containing protein [Pedobacter steynii]SDM61106.1 Ricin-type beta-trefoil lectin domain-like [Pedobacter steynii]
MRSIFKPILGLCLVTSTVFFSCKKNIDNADGEPVSSSRNGDTIVHKLNISGQANIVKEINNEFFYADDIILNKEQFNALKRLTLSGLATVERATIVQNFLKTWPGGKVYYQYPTTDGLTTAQHNSFKATINTALARLTDSTGIQFILRSTQPEYMQFKKHTGNNSPLGWTANQVNTVNMASYTSVGITMHEVMHSLGVMHEQCRPDRNSYVIVDVTKVVAASAFNYNIYADYAGHGPFDFNSVMLYSSWDFANNTTNAPMTKLDGSTFTGQRSYLSTGDARGLRALYFPVVASGIYRISPSYLSTKSVDITGGATANGTDIILYANSTGNNQRFRIRKLADHSYQFKSVLDTTKVLTVEGASTTSGAQVEISTNTSSNAQKFNLYNMGNDGFSFAPRHATTLRLAVKDGSSADLAKIVVVTANTASAAQKFKLTKLN